MFASRQAYTLLAPVSEAEGYYLFTVSDFLKKSVAADK